jgi:hypothetical protein
MAVEGKICIEILTPLSLTSRREGERLLDIWERNLGSYLPDRIGNWEPVDQVFNLADRESVLSRWHWPFLAAKSMPAMESQVFMRKGSMPQHAIWFLSFDGGTADVDQLAAFLAAASTALEADFACLTLLTDAEIEFGRMNGTVSAINRQATRFNFFIASQDIQKYIPDVYWLTVLGPPYVGLFGKDKLLAAPVYRTAAPTDDIVILQLTRSLDEVRETPKHFAEVKEVVKTFLGRHAFFGRGGPIDCNRPDFVWK